MSKWRLLNDINRGIANNYRMYAPSIWILFSYTFYRSGPFCSRYILQYMNRLSLSSLPCSICTNHNTSILVVESMYLFFYYKAFQGILSKSYTRRKLTSPQSMKLLLSFSYHHFILFYFKHLIEISPFFFVWFLPAGSPTQVY